jgi:uncharacterized protein YnzC (UPF0291/DUF896 family)
MKRYNIKTVSDEKFINNKMIVNKTKIINKFIIIKDPVNKFISGFKSLKNKYKFVNDKFTNVNEFGNALIDKNNKNNYIAESLFFDNKYFVKQLSLFENKPEYFLRDYYLKNDCEKYNITEIKIIDEKHYDFLSKKIKTFIYKFYKKDYEYFLKNKLY